MPKKKKILVIIHLCFACTFLCWLVLQPYLKEVMSQKSLKGLYETVIEKQSCFQELSQSDQEALLSGYAKMKVQKPPSLMGQIGHLFFVTTHPFALAWLFFSLAISVLLLFEIEGAKSSLWLLPLIVVGYAFFLYDKPVSKKESIFPSEKYVRAHYVQQESGKNEREKLLLGWHRYLITEWTDGTLSAGGSCKTALPGQIDDFEASCKWQQNCHVPFDEGGPKWAGRGEGMQMASKKQFCRANEFCNCLTEPAHFQTQLEKGLFAFNLARLQWILNGHEDEVVEAGFNTPPSILQLTAYFIWNLLFAWIINRKEKVLAIVAPSPQNCLS